MQLLGGDGAGDGCRRRVDCGGSVSDSDGLLGAFGFDGDVESLHRFAGDVDVIYRLSCEALSFNGNGIWRGSKTVECIGSAPIGSALLRLIRLLIDDSDEAPGTTAPVGSVTVP